MLQQQGVLVKVPASTANLGPGFDSLGMALSLHLWVGMKPAERTQVRLHGPELTGIPTDETNLIVQIAKRVFDEAGVPIIPLDVDVYSEIPLTRGLGSSASAIVGALVAANALIGHPLSQQRLFDMATTIERHPDNVGASLYGGIIVAAWDGQQANAIRVEPHKALGTVVAIPRFHLETKAARHVLPRQVSMADAVYNISRSSLLVAALCTGDFAQLSFAMKDKLHQPYRAPLIPGMSKLLEEAVQHGAYGAALSGAGPTLIAFTNKEQEPLALVMFMRETLVQHGVEADVFQLLPCSEGALCLNAAAEEIKSVIPSTYKEHG
ncbi:homoserine kinase [Paenibacillus taiwanensis]|uniref:homoserine kinase n=1 Tax=Paenibacillus taiwanensis TaxID=401638 RepID=UPI00049049F1|nr:homoserine kinase [Paenibacillus taiwanensis]